MSTAGRVSATSSFDRSPGPDPRPETEGLVELLLGVSSRPGGGCRHGKRVYRTEPGAGRAPSRRSSRPTSPPRHWHSPRENRDRCGARVSLVRGDLCAPLRTGAFDALVSNPPYLTAEEYASLDPSVRDWEPREALVGGADGLEPITRFLDEGREVVRTGGWLALEVDCFRAAECAGRAGALGMDGCCHPC